MNKKKHIVTMAVIMIIIAGGMFYGGMKYGVSKAAADRLAQRGAGGEAAVTGAHT